jgi:NADH-quinone oxidoreductase subunit N
MWVPDAYEGAPTTIGAFLAAGTKNGGFAALLRVFPVALIAFRLDWTATFAILAVLTMTLGNIAALMQKSFTRLLAYSSIAHAGYIMIGLAAPSALGLSGALYHILNQALMKTAAFIAAAAVFRALSTTSVEGYSGLGSRMPVTALTLTFSLFALAGVPPLNGFMSKLVLFTAAIDANISWLALAGVLNSAFSLGYYGWIVKRMYFDEAPTGTPAPENLAFVLPLIAVTILIVVTGVFPQPILALTRGIAEGL